MCTRLISSRRGEAKIRPHGGASQWKLFYAIQKSCVSMTNGEGHLRECICFYAALTGLFSVAWEILRALTDWWIFWQHLLAIAILQYTIHLHIIGKLSVCDGTGPVFFGGALICLSGIELIKISGLRHAILYFVKRTFYISLGAAETWEATLGAGV